MTDGLRPRRDSRVRIQRWAFWAMVAGLWIFVLVGARWYTSFGVDVRRHEGPDRVNQQLRVQYPGDGSLWIGGDRIRRPIFEPLNRVDWGGRAFHPPVRQSPRSGWNEVGFWWVDRRFVNERRWIVHSRWVAVPSWLPAVLASGLAMLPLARRRRQR